MFKRKEILGLRTQCKGKVQEEGQDDKKEQIEIRVAGALVNEACQLAEHCVIMMNYEMTKM